MGKDQGSLTRQASWWEFVIDHSRKTKRKIKFSISSWNLQALFSWGISAYRCVLEIQCGREERVQKVPGACRRELPDTAGEETNYRRCPLHLLLSAEKDRREMWLNQDIPTCRKTSQSGRQNRELWLEPGGRKQSLSSLEAGAGNSGGLQECHKVMQEKKRWTTTGSG